MRSSSIVRRSRHRSRINAARLDEHDCPRCGEELAVHQPDESLPDRLLLTCYGCRTWYIGSACGPKPISFEKD